MDNKNTIRLIIWGVLFMTLLAFGVIGLSLSKAKQRATQVINNSNNYVEQTNENYNEEYNIVE